MSDGRRPDDMVRITTPELAEAFIKVQIEELRKQVGGRKVLLALSGGVDSSVVAAMLIKAIGQQLVCVHVNHGLLRKGEPEQVIEVFRNQMNANLIYVDATDRFLNKLSGVSDPETKRKIIGGEFIEVFAEEARKLDGIECLAQGTIWPDILESEHGIKAHHNAGGLPDDMKFELVEPVRILFKDEVRLLGESLNMPAPLVWRQPFPGPGLAIRILGDITDEKLDILRKSDFILRDEIAKAGLDRSIWQYFTVFTGIRSVGVMGDQRTYDYAIGVRAVTSTDAMTVEFAELPYDLLRTISNRIIAETPHVNRVMFDITDKPPGTIEWE